MLSACRGEPVQPVARHVVLITLDTLRADHLGLYGSDVATPHLDAIAAQGALFERATAHVPLTRPSHVSLFTGRYPHETGVRDNVTPAPVPAVPVLAEVLEAAGFRTAAFVSAVVLAGGSGLERGFDVYSDRFEASPETPRPRVADTAQRRGDQTVAEAVAWLDESVPASQLPDRGGHGRLFLWVHLYDPHEPYAAPEPYRSRYPDRPYAGEVAWTDELVGRLDAALERLGVADQTLVVVASDHGEGLGEHEELLHGFFAYQSTLRVPLLVRGPGIAKGIRITGLAGLVDLFPTVVELAGLEAPADVSGQSFAAALAGREDSEVASMRVLYAETLVPSRHFGWSDLRVARDARFKFIRAPRPELYDLDQDPGELDNVLDMQRSEARRLSAALDVLLARERAETAEAGSLPEHQLEKLRALGYLDGALGAKTSTPGADPKDKIGEFRIANDLMRRAIGSLEAGDFQSAAGGFVELLDRGIESAEIHAYLGRALLDLGEIARAGAEFEAALAADPERSAAWLGLAEVRLQRGDEPGALRALEDGAGFAASNAKLRVERGRVLHRLGRPEEAQRAFEEALPLAPRDARLRVLLAETLAGLGDLDSASARLREAVEIDPTNAAYWNSLGMTAGAASRLEDAEAAFRVACERAPKDARYAYNLGFVLLRLERRDEARVWLEKTIAIDPGFAPARDRLRELR